MILVDFLFKNIVQVSLGNYNLLVPGPMHFPIIEGVALGPTLNLIQVDKVTSIQESLIPNMKLEYASDFIRKIMDDRGNKLQSKNSGCGCIASPRNSIYSSKV